MEIEVKLRLADFQAHQNLLKLLSPFHTQTLLQENIFFDTPNSKLASNTAAFRLRFYNHDQRCVLSIKSKPTLSDGISHIEELEQEIEPTLGRACVAEPMRLLGLHRPNRVLERAEELGLDGEAGGLVCLGGFRNVRNVHEWMGLKVEVDETMFEFGTCYEVECESERPHEAKTMIEKLLKENGIVYSNSKDNKFAIFMSQTLPN